ncbi:hypothetical protein VHEMI02493 [[Torrubiella] hemipterigena]|uniref:CBM21 domain-containing protein n=1 Tax=[Torrubiella] hemipterigena TaxID=1531966 RepID=A0A0A1T8C1_9HYPO|nr:hypothetical protein VHEMI02493 [[Torrubiella] hemipterigena]
MPYTPPSHRSPASSVSTSPDVSRRGSFQHGSTTSLPHSASYLNKHRRTPSANSLNGSSTDNLAGVTENLAIALGATVRQSPPPVTDGRVMPSGAVISPPESAASGSDDEEPSAKSAAAKDQNIKSLRVAVSQIPQGKSGSPEHTTASSVVQEDTSRPLKSAMKTSFSTSALSDLTSRRHTRSSTEPTVSLSAENSAMASSESEEDLKYKPHMVRKKSGELVRPALRSANHRRPLSMPGTPVFSKAVHFDSHLEHVRHFLQVDRPLAVSAGSSPVEAYDSDTEYPFPSGDKKAGQPRAPPFEWELATTNFPRDNNPIRRSLPARLEKVWLSKDQKSMMGSVAVANIAFNKTVVCRFTLDDWKTTSEVAAEYSQAILPKETANGHDRFTFTIQLADTANLECKTLYFCVRYAVSGQEYWDNNNGLNFQVDFQKKHLPQNGKKNFQGASSKSINSLPRSNRRQGQNTLPRPVSFPASFNDFGNESAFKLTQPLHEYLGESDSTGLRLRTKSFNSLASDNLDKTLTSPSGAAFSNRYDFGASLTAAVQAAKDVSPTDKDALYMKGNVRGSSPSLGPSPNLISTHTVVTPAANTTLASSSYEELVNKYCFVRTPGIQTRSQQLCTTNITTLTTAVITRSLPTMDVKETALTTFAIPSTAH